MLDNWSKTGGSDDATILTFIEVPSADDQGLPRVPCWQGTAQFVQVLIVSGLFHKFSLEDGKNSEEHHSDGNLDLDPE